MAEFALGLTKTAVDGTLSLVKSAVEEEKRLRDTIQSDLVFITGEFEVMQSFLRVANRERTAKDEVALTLVRQLRTLAFDVEDCVEFIIHLDKPVGWGWLRRLWQKVNCRAPPLPLDVAVAEIKQLKARVEDVSQRNTRYHQILHASDNDNNKQPVTAMPLPYATTTTTYPSSAAFHNLREAWKATGKWSSNICNLQKELLIAAKGEDDHDLQVISVWGSSTNTSTGGGGADLGTASIFRKAYSDPKICEKFKIRAWVKLTHPFNHDEFAKSLLSQFCATPHQANAEFTEGNIMRRQRYLVVLENVFTLEEWDLIRMYLPDCKNGSRILLSTPQLGIALMCTGEPYQVSELRQFSGDNQYLCAFSKKEKTPSEIGEFVRQLLRGHGVISLWGADDDDKSKLVDILYRGIINGWLEEIEGVVDKLDHVDMLYKGIKNRRRKFELRHSSWVDVPDPFNLKIFAQRLFLNFHSDDIRESEITKVGMKGETGLIEWCRQFLSGEESDSPYVVVINGLRSKDDWDQIHGTFLVSSKATTTAKAAGCYLVITKEETVATHCVKDHTHLAFNAQDLKTDPCISALINKGCWHYAIRGKKGRLFYDRSKDAREWVNKFKDVGGINFDEGKDEEKDGSRVFMVKWDGKTEKFGFGVPTKIGEGRGMTWAEAGRNSEKIILRHLYYGIGRRCSWVDMPRIVDMPWWGAPLNLRDFSWRLLLDFCSDDPQEKEAIAVGLMEGTITDPIGKCREFLRNEKCLVVINGLDYLLHDFEQIQEALFSEQHIQSIILVGPIGDRDRFVAAKALPLGTQGKDPIDMEYRRIFSTQKRYQDAIQWVKPVARSQEVEGIRFNVLTSNFVSVWGISGVGKSTVVRTVYYTEVLYSSGLESSYGLGPTEAFAWVDVLTPFNLTDFAWRLLLSFYVDDPQAKEAAIVSMIEEGRQVPILECCKILRTGKCLVVIDGLRSKQDWDVIKNTFLAEPIQGTIVVITNEEEVAKHCGRTINITGLEANAALSLFKKIASKDVGLTRQELSKSIVTKCGGLPKVIAAVGEASVSMRRERFWDPSSWFLNKLSDNFMGTLEMHPVFHDSLRPLFSWMQSYFDACSDSIKPCIFYLSIFPPAENKSIRRRRLLWRWIVEGYCRDTSDGTTYEENGEKSISELVKLSIIKESANNKVFCEINGFFHEYIISRRMEDNLVFALEKGSSLNSQRAGQHLTIRSTWDRSDEIVYKSIDFSRLRSLTVFGKWKSFFVSIHMRLLRVLDLEDARDVEDEHLEEIAKQLTRLKFLSLRGRKKITRLPRSMCGMRQLQTLDIRGTSVVMLPLFITKLQKLRYISAGTTTEVWDWEGDIVAADGEEEDRASSSSQEGDVVSADGEEKEDRASSSVQAVTNLPAPSSATATATAQAVTNLPMTAATPTEGGMGSMALSAAQAVTNLPAAATIDATPTEAGTNSTAPVLAPDAGNNRTRTLVSSFFLSKLCRRGGGGHDNNNGRPPAAAGVTVPADIGNLSVLHTLGVVKVNAQCGNKAIFQELKKLTQLRKLGVSGINKGNIHEFCEAISGHAHLKSLSVEVDKDDGDLDELDDNIPEPPKAIKSLKLYGRVNKLLVWMNKRLDNLEKLHLTIEKPEELRDPPKFSYKYSGHLRIRPIQDGELRISHLWSGFTRIIEIQCSSRLHIKLGDEDQSWWGVKLLKVHFSGGSWSSLQVSGLSNLRFLPEVWLKGCTDTHKEAMQRQINEMRRNEGEPRPVLKLVQPRSS